ncbi:hypothetical protein VTK73DRAFT_844 [Phialemonium thermophilum]|uniref:Prenylcysteine lyase domain-containing protein n=1 Tax=Phialemonium thermophilum TaxID=223376 RepID=A0ABR3XCC1_9PEZI
MRTTTNIKRVASWAVALLCHSAIALGQRSQSVRNIAVIGAGAAGSSTAYHLYKFAEQDGVAVNVTLFEKTDRIGGRTLTINPFDDPSQAVELGASIFVQINAILYNATQEFGLETTSFGDVEGLLGIWDGEKFVFEIDESLPTWRIALKIFWKYGVRAPLNTNRLMQATIKKFLGLYQAPYFPFRSLTERTYELDLIPATSVNGEIFLKHNNVGESYAHDIVQASTRVNYASNLATIHGLDTMVSMAPEGAVSVVGGNWQIFHSMVKKANTAVAFNTSVTHIDVDQKDASEGKYRLKTRPASTPTEDEAEYPTLFDDVVIASPFQFAKITTADGLLEEPIDEIPYVKLHVTIFASPLTFSPSFFGLPPDSRVPSTILTTLGPNDDANSGVQGAGKAGFYSVSTLRNVLNPKSGRLEHLYKIFSPEKVTPAFLSALFGVPVPDDFTGPVTRDSDDASAFEPISFYYPHVFHSYPKAYPRVTFQDPVLRDGLYYTSGMDSFISTMETNALMGMNVARLIVDDIVGVPDGHAASLKDKQQRIEEANEQKVLGEGHDNDNSGRGKVEEL